MVRWLCQCFFFENTVFTIYIANPITSLFVIFYFVLWFISQSHNTQNHQNETTICCTANLYLVLSIFFIDVTCRFIFIIDHICLFVCLLFPFILLLGKVRTGFLSFRPFSSKLTIIVLKIEWHHKYQIKVMIEISEKSCPLNMKWPFFLVDNNSCDQKICCG